MSERPIKTCEYCGNKGVMPTYMDGETICFDCIKKFPSDLREARHIINNKHTPSSHWKENGNEDPHGVYYNCERNKLCKGFMTDDELANDVYLRPNIGNLTAAKERIRWLSRRLENIKNSKDNYPNW